MVVQPIGPTFVASAAPRSPVSMSQKESSKVQWPEFKVTQPDPVLGFTGEIFSGKGALTPEQTLVEFISTSAAFHGIKKQPLRTLEWDLLKVMPYNVMPANAAAWYMAKRKFYMNQSFDQQLLPYLLKKFPEKFRVLGTQVLFLEVYNKEVARMKLKYLVEYGMNAYFSHKADEYGVYFFDPFYYENTEPFHESLRQSNPQTQNKSKLVSSYFKSKGLKDQFKFEQHSAYLVSICKQPGVKILTNTTGVIISMINNQYGFIKFGSGETALFCCKSLFKDGWQYSGDPLKLPAMKFDGYKIPGGGMRGEQAYSWYAVLVWCGRRPSPKYCSTAEDLNSTPVFREGRIQRLSVDGNPIAGNKAGGRKLRQPSSSMMIGEVLEIKRNGAVLKLRDDSDDRVFIPGWKRQMANSPGIWLSTTTGECLGLGDLVAYYVDTIETRPGFAAVGKNAMVLKESATVTKSVTKSRGRKKSIGRDSTTEDDRSCSDSDLGNISDDELNWLEEDLNQLISKEDPNAKTLKLLQDVKSHLVTVRGKCKNFVKKTNGEAVKFKPGYTPLPISGQNFRRMRTMFMNLENGYESDEDPDYHYGDDVEAALEPRTKKVSTTTTSSSAVSETTVAKRDKNVSAKDAGKKLPLWVRAVSRPEMFDPEIEKFVAMDREYSEDKDPDYVLPETDLETLSSEGEDEELEELVKAALEELSPELKEGKHRLAANTGGVEIESQVNTAGEHVDEDDGSKGPKLWVKELVMNEQSDVYNSEDDPEYIPPSNVKLPRLWVKELVMNEQPDAYNSEDDPEYVPPSVIYETDREYDEFSDGADVIPKDECESLMAEKDLPVVPPSNYIPIWVPVKSPVEKITRAKEQLRLKKLELELKEEDTTSNCETSSKDTDSNGMVQTAVANKADFETVSGLTPMMKKLQVDSTGSKSDDEKLKVDHPKPKRERKKSKSKSEISEQKKTEPVDGKSTPLTPTKPGAQGDGASVAKLKTPNKSEVSKSKPVTPKATTPITPKSAKKASPKPETPKTSKAESSSESKSPDGKVLKSPSKTFGTDKKSPEASK